jgi:hypothetical protein
MKTEDEDAEAEGVRKARECGRIVDRDRRIMFKSKPQQLANWAFLRGEKAGCVCGVHNSKVRKGQKHCWKHY